MYSGQTNATLWPFRLPIKRVFNGILLPVPVFVIETVTFAPLLICVAGEIEIATACRGVDVAVGTAVDVGAVVGMIVGAGVGRAG